ncbi:kelch-like protein 6 isoform X2 [Tetranychus urticae]|uniref:kelch-like protein 6 isoform X2 n=1 Tax=Tetranychus urticae TaxID=32264 RepID=UPI000D648BAB|nr:kelch-like protein 6 isoform X2 [Tetranychus urticae]
MDKEDENCDAKLQILNRKRKYTVSKKFICSTVPYFERMFSYDYSSAPKKNKVELDFDECVFNSILDWIHSGSFCIQMETVISFYDAADYLMINERLLQPCLTYFHENFTVEHLPVVLKQITQVSKLINLGSIENVICRHFLTIANSNMDSFTDYPVEAVESILKLDLMVFSEYQIFESIIKWVLAKVSSRKALLPQLLNCVRWSYMDFDEISKVKDNELIKALPSDLVKSSYVGFDRTKQNFFVSIHQRDTSILKLKAFDNEFFCFTIGDFTQDDSMSLEFVHEEHSADILFDSGRNGIRIDWIKRTFRWLDFKVARNTYYSKLRKFIVEVRGKRCYCYLEDEDATLSFPISSKDYLLLESNGKFIAIGKTPDEKKWFGMFPARHESWFNGYDGHEHSFKATVLDDVVYILTKNLQFIQFNYETKCFNKSEPFKGKKWDYNDLILTSHQTKDDKVYLVNKSSGKVHYFCINQKKWIEKCCFKITYSLNLMVNSF